MNYLVIDQTNTVVNVIIWDGVSTYDPGIGLRVVPADNHPHGVWIGWQHDGKEWVAPPIPANQTEP